MERHHDAALYAAHGSRRPGLLGGALAGDSWRAWRTLLIAANGEALTDDERALFKQFTGRDCEPGRRVEELVGVIGRRGGKSRATSVLACYFAGLCDHRGSLAPGERGVLLCIAPDQRQASITLDYAAAVFDSSPLVCQLVVTRNADTLSLNNGIDLEVRAASFRRLRGPTYVCCIADECAFWYGTDADSANPDTEILNAVRPGLATTGGPLVMISSPYARRGELWDAYRRHCGPAGDPLILVARGASRDFNPSLPQSVVDRAMERDPAAAAAEYLAEFRRDIEAFVAREAVLACVAPGLYERPPQHNLRYAAFVDPSGGSSDSFSLAIAHRDRAVDQVVLDCVREAKPPFSPESVVDEFARVLTPYAVTRVQGDRHGGEFPRELFRRHHIAYEPASRPKSDLYKELLPLINSGRCQLLDHQKLISQLAGLERRTARSGRDSIDHGPGAHDDLANACAGALLSALSSHKRRTLFGSVGYGCCGPVTWRDAETGQEIDPATREPIRRTRVNFVTIPEALAPAARGNS
jgi:hypothetical protein